MRYRTGLGDFASDLLASPQGQAAWKTVSDTLIAEGVKPSDAYYIDRRNKFIAAFSTISDKVPDINKAFSGAAGLILANGTSAGAAQVIDGLVGAMNGQQSAGDSAQKFMGALIATAVAAGAASAGVGAAIIGGVGLLVGLADSLFGRDPGGSDLCNVHSSANLTGSVGCVGYIGDITVRDPKSMYWRHFPDPTNPEDAVWFKRTTQAGAQFFWKGINWWNAMAPLSIASTVVPEDYRPIDAAFPQYRYIECTLLPQVGDNTFSAFNRAFVQAWKANAEFAFNGLRPLPEWQVLSQAAQLWNRAHWPDPGRQVTALGTPAAALPFKVSGPGGMGTKWPSCLGDQNNVIYYYQLGLVEQGGHGATSSTTTEIDFPNGQLWLAGGPRKTVMTPTGYTPPAGALATTPTSSSTAKTVAVTAGGVVAAGLVAAAVKAWFIHKPVDYVLSSAWNSAKNTVTKTIRRR